MKVTINVALALAAAMAFLPTALTTAPEKAPAKEKAAAEASADEGPTPAQLKARKAKDPRGYRKADVALKVAEAANQPILMFILIDQTPANPVSEFLEKKVLTNKLFKELAKENVVLLKLKLKAEQVRGKEKPKKIDIKGLKAAEVKLIQNFGLDEKANKQAMANGQPERTYMDLSNYPAVIGLSPDGAKHLFRMGRYDKDGGMGVWISTVADTLRSAGFEPVVTPLIQQVLDNPDDKKWKK